MSSADDPVNSVLTPMSASAPELSSLKLNSKPGCALICSCPAALNEAVNPSIAFNASAMSCALVSSANPATPRR
jgi:hypothetical protein